MQADSFNLQILNHHNFGYSKLGKFFPMEEMIIFLFRSCDFFPELQNFELSPKCAQIDEVKHRNFGSIIWEYQKTLNILVKYTFFNWDDVEVQLLEWDSHRITIDLQVFVEI